MIECPVCYRTFQTLQEMKRHNIDVHAKGPRSYQPCFICSDVFLGRNVRDQHVLTHFKTITEGLMRNMEEVQRRMGENIMANQCPMCFYVMSTRKSFRHHLLFQHCLKEAASLDILLGPIKVDKRERALVRKLLESPGLIWKRGTIKDTEGEEDEDEEVVDEKEPVDVKPVVRNQQRKPTASTSTSKSGTRRKRTEKVIVPTLQIKSEVPPQEAISTTPPAPAWVSMRNLLIHKCFDETRRWRCKVCEDECGDQLAFEYHVGGRHIDLVAGP